MKYPIPVSKLSRQRRQGKASDEEREAKGAAADTPENDESKQPADLAAAYDRPFSRGLQENIEILKKLMGNSDDVVFREFEIGTANQLPAVLVFIDGLVDKETIQRDTLASLMLWAQEVIAPAVTTPDGIRRLVADNLLSMLEVKETEMIPEAVDEILNGDAILLIDGLDAAFVLGVKSWQHRGIDFPVNENSIRGPHEAFNELFKNSVALIRRRIKDPQLRVKFLRLGERSRTDIALVYIEDIANPALVNEVKRRLDLIKTDSIMDSSYLEQYIQDQPFSPFPQVQWTERPDRAAAEILEGRIALLSDGSPNALLVPATLPNFLPASEDYYERAMLSTVVRAIRTASIVIAILLPSLYVAVISFHHELLPTFLALTIAGSRANVPFSSVAEALVMELTFELLREAGLRLPAPLGWSIGIVGGIIIGQSAVSAGLVSPIMVVVVALTAIGAFSIPSYNVGTSIRMLRFPLLFLAGTFGLFGVTAGIILILLHLVSLKSFGVPYLSPVAPAALRNLTDTIVRAPIHMQRLRPLMYRPQDLRRSAPRSSYYQNRQEMHEHGFETRPLLLQPTSEKGYPDEDTKDQ